MLCKKILLILFILLLLPSISIASNFEYIWSSNLSDSSIPVLANENPPLNLESTSAILIEQSTGEILFEKNSHEKLRPASVTKIMSILLIMEALDRGDLSLDTPIPCSEHARSMGGSQIW